MRAPWKDRFLNVVERSFLELNIEFVNYSIGQIANSESRKRIFDPAIQGLEFADELTACSAIVNDCISSPLINGDLDQDNKNDLKFYRVNREIAYSKSSIKRVDITVKRVSYEQIIKKAGGRLNKMQVKAAKKNYMIGFIEAKRAKRYPKSHLTNELVSGKWTYTELQKNIQDKLRIDPAKKRYNHILVWGIYNNTQERNNTPKYYLDKLCEGAHFKIVPKIRWIPLSWDIFNDNIPPKNIVINRWCWIILGQIHKKNR
jgi:hypothetical protein